MMNIWRYIDFSDLLAMLEFRGLFFATPTCFDDPYEGTLNIGSLKTFLSQLPGDDWHELKDYFAKCDRNRSDAEKLESALQCLKQMTYVNCWHMNNFESVAMWKLYSLSKLGVAIRSTKDALERQLSGKATIVPVRYIDYHSDESTIMDMSTIYFYKRKAFEYEQELRAFFINPSEFPDVLEHRESGKIPQAKGEWFRVDLDDLIEEVVIAPMAQSWTKDLVERVLKRYGLQKPVRESELLVAPPIPSKAPDRQRIANNLNDVSRSAQV
jgi:hypothetical protein